MFPLVIREHISNQMKSINIDKDGKDTSSRFCDVKHELLVVVRFWSSRFEKELSNQIEKPVKTTVR